jgi:hypothetical protein
VGLSDGGGAVGGVFYTHNFALTGGQEMELADPSKVYEKPPESYRTFFQQAVEEIG